MEKKRKGEEEEEEDEKEQEKKRKREILFHILFHIHSIKAPIDSYLNVILKQKILASTVAVTDYCTNHYCTGKCDHKQICENKAQ